MAKGNRSGGTGSGLMTSKEREQQALYLQSQSQTLAELFVSGELEQVEQRALDLLAQFPVWGFGWKVLTGTYAMQSRNEEALLASKKAAHYCAADPEVHNNQGNILKDLGRFTEAIACYEKAIKL